MASGKWRPYRGLTIIGWSSLILSDMKVCRGANQVVKKFYLETYAKILRTALL